ALQSEAMDNGYRGLSKENIRQHVIDLQNKEVLQYFFKKTSSLLGKDYSKSSWMCERNIMIPLYGEDNTIDRVLLRSSINPSTEPKEIQLILKPSKETRDFLWIFQRMQSRSSFVNHYLMPFLFGKLMRVVALLP